MPSQVIKGRRYEPESRTLFIIFPKRETYAYADVEPEAFEAMNEALSKGHFFQDYIRDFYRYGKVVDPANVVFGPAKRDIALRPPLPRRRTTRRDRNGDSASPPPAGAGR